MRSLMLAALLLSPAARAADLDALCTWTDARWERHAQLYLPGTSTPFAAAGHEPSTRLDGTLGYDDWGQLRFRGDLQGDDVSLHGDVAYNDANMFRLSGDDPVKVGEMGLVLPGATVAVKGAVDGTPVVEPSSSALDEVSTWPRRARVPCERLNVHRIGDPWDGYASVLERAGFDPDLPEHVLRKGTRVNSGPRGRRLGRFRPVDYDRPVFLVERDSRWARVVRATWQGVVWTGWVPVRKLDPAREGKGAGGLGVLAAAAQKGEEIPVRRCDEDLGLFAAVPGRVAEVGTVHAGTKMQIGEAHGDHVAVTFPGGWVDPVDDSTLLVPARAAACAADTWQYVPPKALQELVEQADASDDAPDLDATDTPGDDEAAPAEAEHAQGADEPKAADAP